MSSIDSTSEEKHRLRQQMKQLRANCPDKKREAYAKSLALHADDDCYNKAANPLLKDDSNITTSSPVVAGYHPFGSELSPLYLMQALEKHGFTLALPCIIASNESLIFRRYHFGDALTPHLTLGIMEPLQTAQQLTPDIILLPLLAYDENNHRLGYGGGYYDRTIARYPDAMRIGIAYPFSKVDRLPHGPYDQTFHHIHIA